MEKATFFQVPGDEYVSKADVEAILAQVERMKQVIAEKDPFSATTEDALEALKLNRHNLRQWQKDGVFRPGHEWIKRAPGPKAPMWWNIDACHKALAHYNANRVERYTGVPQ